MQMGIVVASFLLQFAASDEARRAPTNKKGKLIRTLLAQGASREQIIGFDADGIPIVFRPADESVQAGSGSSERVGERPRPGSLSGYRLVNGGFEIHVGGKRRWVAKGENLRPPHPADTVLAVDPAE